MWKISNYSIVIEVVEGERYVDFFKITKNELDNRKKTLINTSSETEIDYKMFTPHNFLEFDRRQWSTIKVW